MQQLPPVWLGRLHLTSKFFTISNWRKKYIGIKGKQWHTESFARTIILEESIQGTEKRVKEHNIGTSSFMAS